jgi:hypothetical protein
MKVTQDHFAQRILLRAGEYFADLDPGRITVRFLRARATTNSKLFEFQVTDGISSHNVVAKSPFSPRRLRKVLDGHGRMQVEKPRLFPLAETQVKGLHEFRALSAIYDHFTRLNDPRFGAIRPLDVCGKPCSLMMEKADDPRLQVACRKVNRIQHRFASTHLRSAMGNAGAWLRSFHELPLPPQTENCNTHRGDIIAAIEMFTDYLAKQTPYNQFFRELCQKLVQAADGLLPDTLPLGLTHRDFAPRNVLVSSEGRVTVFDTEGRWRAPVYADLAHFLVALKVSSAQIWSAGWYYDARTLAAFERDFLRGYFEETTAPTGAIRLFECLWVLEWWVALAHYRHKAKGLRRAVRWGQLHFCSRYLKVYLRSMVDWMDDYCSSGRGRLIGVLVAHAVQLALLSIDYADVLGC